MIPDDWALWRDVRLEALASDPDAFCSTRSEWADADEARWRERLTTVPYNAIAFVGEQPVGQVSGSPVAPGRVELMSMWVRPDSRGHGVSGSLIDEVIGYAAQLGATEVVLAVRPSNDRAIRVYERAGFALTDTTDGDGNLVMVRSITD